MLKLANFTILQALFQKMI